MKIVCIALFLACAAHAVKQLSSDMVKLWNLTRCTHQNYASDEGFQVAGLQSHNPGDVSPSLPAPKG